MLDSTAAPELPDAVTARPRPRAGPRHYDFLMLGGGLASASAAETLRLEGCRGSIGIVGAEPYPPYQRPGLSKRLLLTEAFGQPSPVLRSQTCQELAIDVLTGVRVTAVDPVRRVVHTDGAGTLGWGKLLIATGASPLRLQLPGAGLSGIHCLRTRDDARAIHAAARPGARVVVVGSSFIGMEVSATLRQKGVAVTIATQRDQMFPALQSAAVAGWLTAQCASHGIDIVIGEVAAFEGRGRVRAVRLADRQRLACDFVVLGVGVVPETDFLAGSGIEVGDGIVVNDRLEASVPHVYAAGDVANFPDPVSGRRRRVEHWDNAVKQGRLAARNMLGQGLPLDDVSMFYCEVFERSFQVIGVADGAGRPVEMGSLEQGEWAALYLKHHIPCALVSTGRPAAETRAVRQLIRHRTYLKPWHDRLGRDDFSLLGVPSQNVLILQGGGALGAFECGVVKALEQRHVYPDVVAGVSIGAFNGAIIASHPGRAAQALESFWNDLSMHCPELPDERMRRLFASTMALCWGVPGFFRPRWAAPWAGLADGTAWTSFYDTTPLRGLLAKYVDFEALPRSPVRLLISAVDVVSAELKIFDSRVETLTCDHLLASGSLPPGLPWTTVGGRHYWDGGIVSNSPLDLVAERCGATGKRVFIVDLFATQRPLPLTLADVLMRRDEITYAERLRRTSAEDTQINGLRTLVEECLDGMEPQQAARMRQHPRYVDLVGDGAPPEILRIVRQAAPGELASRDFDFSARSVRAHVEAGHAAALHALATARSQRQRAGTATADDHWHSAALRARRS